MTTKIATIFTLTALLLAACDPGVGLPPTTSDTRAQGTGAVSTATTPGTPAPSPTPSATPTAPALDGSYRLRYTRCNTTTTNATAEQYIDISEDRLQVRTYLTPCSAVKPTILYELTSTGSEVSMNPIYTDVYNAPGTCASPTRNYQTGSDWTTQDYAFAGNFLVLISRNNCDGQGHKTLTYYERQ